MNTQHTLDLDYADPPVPPHLLERTRRQGRQLRRRPRVAAAASVMTLVAVVTLGVQSLYGGVSPFRDWTAAPASTNDLAKLPISVGHGPSAEQFTIDGYSPGDTESHTPVPPVGLATVVAPAQGAQKEQLIWVTKDARFVIGDRDKPGADLQTAAGRVLNGLPAEGFWGGMSYSDNTLLPPERGKVRTIIAGLVRGPVTKVLIDLPSGSTAAHLAVTSNPELGTIYWVVTDVFDSSGHLVLPTATDSVIDNGIRSITRTAYRGNIPVFHCAGDTCLGQT